MHGYLGPPGDSERLMRFERHAGAPFPAAYRQGGFAVAITSRPGAGESIHRGEIAADPWHVLAFEGYASDMDPAAASQPATWLLARHEREGLAAFDNLNGAYAFCLFARRAHRAWIGACGFGRRDLYYLREDDTVCFATDLTKLLRLVSRRPGLAAGHVRSAFFCGAVYGGATLLTGVRRALPGAVVGVTLNAATEAPPPPMPAPSQGAPCTEHEVLEDLDTRLRTALARLTRVRARPTVLMSAGVDSPLVAAYAKAVTGELRALTLAMPWPPDETEPAAAITRQLGGVHHACRFGVEDIDVVADLDAFVRAMEEPVSFGLGLLMTRLAGHACVISDGFVCGVGADLLFGDPVHEPDFPSTDSIHHYVFRDIAPDRVAEVVRLTGAHPDAIVPRLRRRLRRDPERRHLRLPLLLQSGLMIRTAARLARFHDREALFPYLDRDVVDLAVRLPAVMRTRSKPLLRALATRHYGPELQRPAKVPFTAYPVPWLHRGGRLGPLLDLLDERRTRERGVYRTRALQRVVESYRRPQLPERHWNLVLWQVAVFELFCRRFLDAEQPGAVAARARATA